MIFLYFLTSIFILYTVVFIAVIFKISIIIKKTKLNYYFDEEFMVLIKAYIQNINFISLKENGHHNGISVYNHLLAIAYLTYKIKDKKNKKDAVIGALLHDYYLYNWHLRERKHRFHSVRHPHIALKNARNDFELSKKSEDIILKHMFPVTFYLIPKYTDTWLVSFIDKYVSFLEFFNTTFIKIEK